VRVAHGSVNLGLPAEFPAATCALVAPISSPERSYGWLCLADKIGAEEFDADDEQMLNTLGAQVGRIYENRRLYRELQQYATQLLIEMEERERTTAELRNSEERFRQLAENIDDALFMTNAELSTPIYVSPAYNRIWGRSNAQLTSNPAAWLEAVHPEDRERVIRAHESAVHNWPAHASLEFRIVRPMGRRAGSRSGCFRSSTRPVRSCAPSASAPTSRSAGGRRPESFS
jgi:PAS domain S-box-containing protein